MAGPPTRGRPSLIAAAQAQSRRSDSNAPSSFNPDSGPSTHHDTKGELSAMMGDRDPRDSKVSPSESLTDLQRPTLVSKMRFKPSRKVKLDPDKQPDVAPAAVESNRGGLKGRGRGFPSRGRGTPVVSTSIAAGPFGGPRHASASAPLRRSIPISASGVDSASAEVYSDHSDQEASNIIDIDAVSGLGESAPTSLIRNRDSRNGKVERKAGQKLKNGSDVDEDQVPRVKVERLSPVKKRAGLPSVEGNIDPSMERDDDVMMSGDEEQDRDRTGRRVRAFAAAGGLDAVNESQKVDLSESEEDEEEESMEGDFVAIPGYDDPQDKLFVFQFPNLFPRFDPAEPMDSTAAEEVKPDVKPSIAHLRAKKKNLPPPEGRVGTMVVMRSGKVKLVLGDDIVMNVTPGIPSTFLQQLVYLDTSTKSAVVLGEAHKQYVVTPDIDHLLHELYLNGGATPGDKEMEAKKAAIAVKREEGAVKTEIE